MGCISRIQGQFNFNKSINVKCNINRIKDKNHLIISKDTEKSFAKTEHHLVIKILNKLGVVLAEGLKW
jgi:formiminotetrahydrofolate cyclodeaminase